MSDPRYTDPRLSDPPLREETRREQRLGELEESNAMWGWIAGGVVLALLLVFIFGRSPDSSGSASNEVAPQPPAATTGMAPPRNPSPAPSTTGSGMASPPAQPSPAPAQR